VRELPCTGYTRGPRDPVKDLYIVIPNWGKFQHYKDRRPVWIKLYTELNSRDDWLELTDAERGLLVLIWIEYARAGGRLRVSRLPSSGRQKGRKRGLERLNDAGFIELLASPEVQDLLEKSSTYDSKEQDLKTFLDDITRGLRAMPA
jgi:hypothetical protein